MIMVYYTFIYVVSGLSLPPIIPNGTKCVRNWLAAPSSIQFGMYILSWV